MYHKIAEASPLPFWHSPWTSAPSQNSALSHGEKPILCLELLQVVPMSPALSLCLGHTRGLVYS